MTKGRLRLHFHAGKITHFSVMHMKKLIKQTFCNHPAATGPLIAIKGKTLVLISM